MIFTPTYLYIKQHVDTGKCYFGKTVRDPLKYLGSGTRWHHHIKKHGIKNIETLWYCLFTEQEELTKFALLFSEQQDIVKSELWLNLAPENGLDGTFPGTKRSKESIAKMSLARLGVPAPNRGKKHSPETRAKMSASSVHKGKKMSPISIAKRSASVRGKSQKKIECPHCRKAGGSGAMKVWHFDNCRLKGDQNASVS